MANNRLLIDFGALSCGCTDHALESLAKAMSGEDDAGPDIGRRTTIRLSSR